MACIYVFSSPNGYVKVGRARIPRERFGAVQTGSPLPLVFEYQCECPDIEAVEAAIHRDLQPHHQHGEWFAMHTEQAVSVVRTVIGARFVIADTPHVPKGRGRIGRILARVSETATRMPIAASRVATEAYEPTHAPRAHPSRAAVPL